MLIKIKRGWELPESAATDEGVYLERRRLCKAIAAGPILLAGEIWAYDGPELQPARSAATVKRAAMNAPSHRVPTPARISCSPEGRRDETGPH